MVYLNNTFIPRKKGGRAKAKKELTNDAIVLVKTAKIFKQHAAAFYYVLVAVIFFVNSVCTKVTGGVYGGRGNSAAPDASTTSSYTTRRCPLQRVICNLAPFAGDNYKTDEVRRAKEEGAEHHLIKKYPLYVQSPAQAPLAH